MTALAHPVTRKAQSMSSQHLFALRTHGGLCAGEQWIYDRDQPIARLGSAPVEQPEQNLRYFNQNHKPVVLRDLRLSPGGRPLVAGVQLFWNLRTLITSELVDIRAQGQDTGRLALAITTREPGGVATSRCALAVSWDAALESYVYDLETRLELHSPEVFDNPREFGQGGHIQFQYSDPWYCDVPGPTVEFPGMWRKRYSHLLAEPAEGPCWQMPLNHLATGIPSPQRFKRGGLFVLAHDPGNNPAFEFVGQTADRTAVAVCNWGYDIHLLARYTRDELYSPICERFRVRLCPEAQARQIHQAAAPVPPIAYRGFAELPLYERRTSFARGLRLDQPTAGLTDPWPWLPQGEGAEWCRTEGRSDTCSLKISKITAGPTEWIMDREGDGAWTQKWTPSIGFRVSVYIKTENVAGRGSCLAVRWDVHNEYNPERYPYRCSQKLTGTCDWTRVQVEICGPPPPAINAVCLILRQDGSGATWFDDLEVEVL